MPSARSPLAHALIAPCMAVLALCVGLPSQSLAQSQLGQNSSGLDNDQIPNVITTAVPFLLIAPDSRSGALGEAGAALSPDANSLHWNPSKIAFAEQSTGISLSYTPWLRNLGVRDIGLAYVSFYQKFGKLQAFGASLRYFNLGSIIFTDVNGSTIGEYRPNEFAVDATYSRKLSERFSLGVTGRFIYSNLTLGQFVGATPTKAGVSAAGDISGYYVKPIRKQGSNLRNSLAFGFNVSNLGAKINYTNSALNNFLPTNLRLGTAYTLKLDEFNDVTFLFDVNKLLVPTPPYVVFDSTGRVITDGKDNNVPPLQGVFQSFGDAPLGGREELREYNIALGAEYWYDKQFALRAGYHNEHVTKGARQFLTFGAGLKYNVFGLDLAYLVPTRNGANSPLTNTIRFSLKFDLRAFKAGGTDASGIDVPDENADRQRRLDEREQRRNRDRADEEVPPPAPPR